jgi:phosphoribosylformylglycinamidine (FGAM) synthase-like enzyme
LAWRFVQALKSDEGAPPPGHPGGIGISAKGALDSRSQLFSETPTRFLLEVEPSQLAAVETALGAVPHAVVGETVAEQHLRVTHGDTVVVERDLAGLQRAWREPLFQRYG